MAVFNSYIKLPEGNGAGFWMILLQWRIDAWPTLPLAQLRKGPIPGRIGVFHRCSSVSMSESEPIFHKDMNKIVDLPSGNQTWQWKMDHLPMIFLLKPPVSSRIFQPAMFDETRGYQSLPITMNHYYSLLIATI